MSKSEIEGFADPDELDDGDDDDLKVDKKKSSKKSGGFQAMGLSFPVLKGIQKRGYKIPTPIQRKTIPLVLEGRDIVAMARTGSGKTACFLIPMFEKLKMRQAKAGARALILSPTRELALQTLKFIKEIGRFVGLKAAVIIGGDNMDNQFGVIHGNPDIIVATPGRFLHICVEMDLKLNGIEYIVFDEADRLFEMGFGDQLQEILNRLSSSRQTLLFSATLPKILVEFAKAGLSDPVLLRLDVESKLPEELTLEFIVSRSEEKLAVLLCLLKNIIKPEAQTVVFAATSHHVEYIHMLLDKAHVSNTYIYSNLDPSARKINSAKFKSGKAKVLVVTDVAARGIDIPQLDNVINVHFPPKSKLFVHRVGRCARAGRTGTAYSIVSPDEYSYLLDLHLFLGRSFHVMPSKPDDNVPEGAIGKLPQSMVEEQLSELILWQESSMDLQNMKKVCSNGYQKYIRSRPGASSDSVKRIKELAIDAAGVIPQYRDVTSAATDLLSRMKNYRPQGTVFEIGMKPTSVDYTVMKAKRAFHKENIHNFHRKKEEREEKQAVVNEELGKKSNLVQSSADDIDAAFKCVIAPKKRKMDDLYKEKKKKKPRVTRDEEFYIPYAAADKLTEEGLAVNSFSAEAEKMQMDLTADSEDSRRLQTQLKRWDRKKKKMVHVENNSKTKKIRTESGVWIPATYKSNRYSQWKNKTKTGAADDDNDEDEQPASIQKLQTASNTHWARHNQKVKDRAKSKAELKRPEQILKARIQLEKKQRKHGRKKGNGRGRGKGSKGKGKGRS